MINEEIEIKTENLKEFEKIVEVYRGDYFEANDYLWSKDEKEHISQLYIDILKQIAKYYIMQDQHNQAILYLKKILEKDYYIEEVHRMILEVYKNIADKASFDEHNGEVKKIFNDELGVEFLTK